MDASRRRWYFSTMRHVAFHRTKYGRELLVDAARVREMPGFIRANRAAHSLEFHDILLVTRGTGALLLDGQANPVSPGVVVFTLPGQVRQWQVEDSLDGACLFFPRDFTADVFSDPRFLDHFAFFSPRRPSAALVLGVDARRQFLDRFAAMQREIAGFHSDVADAMRAQLYELLVMLNRCYIAQHGMVAMRPGDIVERYLGLIQRRFARSHRVADYAASLRISPGHLNALCREALRSSAGTLIRERIALEARRLLLYSDLTATQIAERLGFDDPAYFARFFRREVGISPTRFRLRSSS